MHMQFIPKRVHPYLNGIEVFHEGDIGAASELQELRDAEQPLGRRYDACEHDGAGERRPSHGRGYEGAFKRHRELGGGTDKEESTGSLRRDETNEREEEEDREESVEELEKGRRGIKRRRRGGDSGVGVGQTDGGGATGTDGRVMTSLAHSQGIGTGQGRGEGEEKEGGEEVVREGANGRVRKRNRQSDRR